MKRSSGKQQKTGERIAVVEEVADNIYSIKFILQSLGYDVGSFSVALPRYLEDLAQFNPGLVIVDMMIPHRGGYRVIKGIRNGPLAQVPILAITAEAMEGDEAEVLDAGAHDILAKPYAVADLQGKLEEWLK